MKTSQFFLLAAVAMTSSLTAAAQTHYTFNCRDYISTDNARAPQSAFSYDTDANTFSIAASGANNVAFQMNIGMDGEYFIEPDETLLLICGENLSTTATASYVWWLNGYNDGGQVQADQRLTDGTDAVLVWNLKTNTAINRNFDWTKERISISANGASFINAIGLTAQNSSLPGTVKDVGYYAPFEVAAKHPALMSNFGFDEESLTDAIKAKILSLDATKQTEVDAVETYTEAYALYLEVRQATNSSETTFEGTFEAIERGIMVRLNEQQYVRIQFVNDSTVRVSKAMTEADLEHESWAVITLPDNATQVTVVSTDDQRVMLSTPKMRIVYDLTAGTADFYHGDGTPMFSEVRHRFVETKDGPFDSYTLSQYFLLSDDERIYGLGQIQDGALNRRGTVVHLEQENRRISIPYFLSSKNYGFYWDNYSPTTFNDVGTETFFRSTGRTIDYYVLSAENSHEVQRSLRHLTGQTELPPLWNFGLYQSKERYASAQEVMDVVTRYRNEQIPLDCIVQDWQYWGDDAHWNAMEFLNSTYSSNYQQMVDFVHNQNAKIMISIWASFGPQTKPYAELSGLNLLLPGDTWPRTSGSRPYNVYSSEARDIYWKYLYEGIASKGFDAYWMDSTEPDYFGGDAGLDWEALPNQTWRSLRNVFPLATVSGVAQHHRAEPTLSDKRVSIMTRSGYVGMQRTGAYVWSADINGDWATLANQIPAACNLAECGLPYWNSDTGGFFVTNNEQWHRLYTRWTQFSTFTPMLRFHGTGTAREPWQFGSKGDAAGEYDNIVRYIKMRYRLLPYLYSTAHQVRTDAQSFMQSLPIAFPEDADGYDITDQYMFGKAFLVAPVVQDVSAGRNVYLPQSSKWIDFWTGYTYDGGQTIFKQAPADIMPLYVRAGSILPWGPEVQYSSEKPWDQLELRIYPGADGTFTLYEDEFDNYNYENGQYTEIPMRWDNTAQTLTIGARKGSYEGMMNERTFRIVVVNPDKGTTDAEAPTYDATVTYTGEEIVVQLVAENIAEPVAEDYTPHIVNPSFEADGRALTKVAPQGWQVQASTTWWGVNLVGSGATGDPQPTDGQYIFGVWDANPMTASISQTISDLPEGQYRLTVDMHASNRTNMTRLGEQCVFANDNVGYLRDQVNSVGTSDAFPLQTISVDFVVENDNDPVKIGVSTANAPSETWFKIDNFRLYRLEEQTPTGIEEVQSTKNKAQGNDVWYTLSGLRVKNPTRGIYVHNGQKTFVQ